MKVAALFAWVLVPLAFWLAVESWGTPHLVTSYRFYDNGDVYNPTAPRRYIDCTYFGWQGLLRVPATNARCPWVRMFKLGR